LSYDGSISRGKLERLLSFWQITDWYLLHCRNDEVSFIKKEYFTASSICFRAYHFSISSIQSRTIFYAQFLLQNLNLELEVAVNGVNSVFPFREFENESPFLSYISSEKEININKKIFAVLK